MFVLFAAESTTISSNLSQAHTSKSCQLARLVVDHTCCACLHAFAYSQPFQQSLTMYSPGNITHINVLGTAYAMGRGADGRDAMAVG